MSARYRLVRGKRDESGYRVYRIERRFAWMWWTCATRLIDYEQNARVWFEDYLHPDPDRVITTFREGR